MFADIDCGLRELGIGDMGIGKRVKMLARNLYGRIDAYDSALESDTAALAEALGRNLYATAEPPRPEQLAALGAYTRREAEALQTQSDGALLAGEVRFGSAPQLADAPQGAGG